MTSATWFLFCFVLYVFALLLMLLADMWGVVTAILWCAVAASITGVVTGRRERARLDR